MTLAKTLALVAVVLRMLILFSEIAGVASEDATTRSSTVSTVATLNRVTFTGNVFGQREGGQDGWVVLFCASWFETCQGFESTFLETAQKYGGTSVDDLFSRSTRFATVDCAVDKELCNTQDVEAYPTAVHYRRGGRAGEWSQSGRTVEKEAKGFKKWLDKQMQETDKPASVAPLAEARAEAAAAGGVAKFTSGIPLKQALPMVVALAAGGLWLGRLSAELREALQLLREPGLPPAAERKPDVEQLTEPLAEEEALLPVIVRSLPEEWARAVIEL